MNTNDPYAGERLKTSPFYPRRSELNIRDAWSAWNGYKFAEYYYDAEYEYFLRAQPVRHLRHLPDAEVLIKGRDAEAMLNRMVTRDVTKLGLNRVTYVVWCTDEGRMVDDGTIFKLADDEFMLTCGSPCIAWLRMSAFGFEDVTITTSRRHCRAVTAGAHILRRAEEDGPGGYRNAKPFDICAFLSTATR